MTKAQPAYDEQPPVPSVDGSEPGKAAATGKSGCWAGLTAKYPLLKTKKGLALVIGVPLLIIAGGLCGLAALNGRSSGGRGTSGNVISDDGHFFGQSPAVYPSRESMVCGK